MLWSQPCAIWERQLVPTPVEPRQERFRALPAHLTSQEAPNPPLSPSQIQSTACLACAEPAPCIDLLVNGVGN